MNWHKKQTMNYKKFLETFQKSSVSHKKLNLIVALLLAASSAFAQVPSYVPTNGLVGWWPFNGNANDESGNGYNGTVIGASYANNRLGQSNSAILFNGATQPNTNNTAILRDEGMTINNFNTTFSNQMTVTFWINVAPTSNGDIFNKRTDNNIDFVCTTTTGNAPYFHLGNMGQLVSTTTVPFNEWHQYSYVLNNGIAQVYLDGILNFSGQLSGSISNNTNWIGIGKYVYHGGLTHYFYYNGLIDDIGIWNRALTQQEITTLYNAQSCSSTSNTITADGSTTFCAGNFVNLTSDVVGGTYQWKKNGVNISTNATTKTYKATTTGSYTCAATCNGTALTSNAIAVTSKTNASATVSASGATSFCAGDSVTLNATNLGSNYSVQWYRTNISMENATAYSQVVKQPGTYKVVTKNLTTGCSRISGSAITTSVNCRIAGDVTSGSIIQENTNVDSRFIDNELSQGVHIYPNPNSGVFSFNYDGEETGDAVLQIINNMGQSIYQSRLTVPEGGFTQELQLGDNITKGIYIVRLLINDSYHDSKVMVK